MTKKTLFVPIEAVFPELFTMSLDSTWKLKGVTVVATYTEVFSSLSVEEFKEMVERTLPLMQSFVPVLDGDAEIDTPNKTVTIKLRGSREAVLRYFFGELVGQIFTYRDEIAEWADSVKHMFPEREPKKMRILRPLPAKKEETR